MSVSLQCLKTRRKRAIKRVVLNSQTFFLVCFYCFGEVKWWITAHADKQYGSMRIVWLHICTSVRMYSCCNILFLACGIVCFRWLFFVSLTIFYLIVRIDLLLVLDAMLASLRLSLLSVCTALSAIGACCH